MQEEVAAAAEEAAEQTAELTMMEQAEGGWETAKELLMTYGIEVVWALVILIIGMRIAGFVKNMMIKGFKKSDKIDDTVGGFLASMVRYVILAVTIMAVLERFGVETTSLVAILGAMGLAIGLAMKDTLSNITAGIMLLVFRPFKVGNFVEVAGHAGTVKEISLFTTNIDTGDNKRIIVPNSAVWGSSITNYNFNNTRRVDMVMGVSYDDDLAKTKALIEGILDADDRILKDPAYKVAVSELADSSVNFVVRPWVNSGDYWGVLWDFTQNFKEACDREGISIPYPCQSVYHVHEEAPSNEGAM